MKPNCKSDQSYDFLHHHVVQTFSFKGVGCWLEWCEFIGPFFGEQEQQNPSHIPSLSCTLIPLNQKKKRKGSGWYAWWITRSTTWTGSHGCVPCPWWAAMRRGSKMKSGTCRRSWSPPWGWWPTCLDSWLSWRSRCVMWQEVIRADVFLGLVCLFASFWTGCCGPTLLTTCMLTSNERRRRERAWGVGCLQSSINPNLSVLLHRCWFSLFLELFLSLKINTWTFPIFSCLREAPPSDQS